MVRNFYYLAMNLQDRFIFGKHISKVLIFQETILFEIMPFDLMHKYLIEG